MHRHILCSIYEYKTYSIPYTRIHTCNHIAPRNMIVREFLRYEKDLVDLQCSAENAQKDMSRQAPYCMHKNTTFVDTTFVDCVHTSTHGMP